jgi:hypothetical protein
LRDAEGYRETDLQMLRDLDDQLETGSEEEDARLRFVPAWIVRTEPVVRPMPLVDAFFAMVRETVRALAVKAEWLRADRNQMAGAPGTAVADL